MNFSWILVLVTLMAGSTSKRTSKRGKGKKKVERISRRDYGISESEASSVDWDALANESEDDAGIDQQEEHQPEELKQEEPQHEDIQMEEPERAGSPKITYRRRRSVRSRGVHFNESWNNPPMGQQTNPAVDDIPTPSQPSVFHQGEPLRDSERFSSILRDQQQLMTEHARLALNVERVSAELKAVKKKQSALSRMLTNIYSLIGCSNSVDLDSD